ncbi:MAG: 4-hydroxy-tetrahydrodipicolinate synthase, partial [archaeon]|nr:4-hydroxy-tetrahydrodipicolinate synthase [archaeon]
MNFEGTAVAMVTPFNEDLTIDEEGFRQNINWLIDQGVDGLVGVGTTGESATLTHEEHHEVIDILIDEVDGRVTTFAGTGSNSTDEALSLTKYAEDAGADFALVITPYYNKPQQHGVIEHFRQLNDKCDIDIVAYNVPSRTGLDMAPETIVELAKMDNITALKEASSDVDKASKTMRLLRQNQLEDDIVILSGSDELTLPLMSIGAKGVISASANIDPRRMVLMVNSVLDGQMDKALDLHYEMYDLIKALFMESSPAPAKEALKM